MNNPTFLERLKGLPILFPLIGVFHFVMLGVTTYSFAKDGVLDTFLGLGSALEWLVYALLWLGVCMQLRWTTIAYIILTAVNLILLFLTPQGSHWKSISDTLFPFDVLMCFFLLFYYKRFR